MRKILYGNNTRSFYSSTLIQKNCGRRQCLNKIKMICIMKRHNAVMKAAGWRRAKPIPTFFVLRFTWNLEATKSSKPEGCLWGNVFPARLRFSEEPRRRPRRAAVIRKRFLMLLPKIRAASHLEYLPGRAQRRSRRWHPKKKSRPKRSIKWRRSIGYRWSVNFFEN